MFHCKSSSGDALNDALNSDREVNEVFLNYLSPFNFILFILSRMKLMTLLAEHKMMMIRRITIQVN